MRQDSLAIALVCIVAPGTAMACTLAYVEHTISDDVRASHVVLLATARESGRSYGHFVTFDVQRTYKGDVGRQVEVRAQCMPSACEAVCFRAGQPVVLFLVKARDDHWSGEPRYEHALPYWGVNQVVDGHVQFNTIPWRDARDRRNLKGDGLKLAGGEYDTYWGMPLEAFEDAVRASVGVEGADPGVLRLRGEALRLLGHLVR